MMSARARERPATSSGAAQVAPTAAVGRRVLTAARGQVVLAVVGITALALVLRLVGLERKSVWFDEAISVGFAALPVPGLLAATSNDPNPPLYYLLLHLWLPLATNDFWLRLPSAAFSAAAVGLSVLLGRAMWRLRAGVLGGAFTALCALHIDLAQEARGYGLLTCLGTASLWLLWRAQQRPTWPRWLGYALVTALALYTHNYAMFLLLAEATYLLATRALGRRALVALGLIGGLWLAWLPVLVGQLGLVQSDYWIEPPGPSALGDAYFGAIAYTPPAHGWGMSLLDRGVRWGLLLVLGLGILSGLRQRGVLLLALAVLVPVLLSLGISIWLTPIYVVRYLGFVLPAFWLVVARGLDVLPTRVLPVLGGLAVVVELGLNLPPLYTDPFYARADLRQAAAIVRAESASDEKALVVHSSPFTQYPFAYYDREQVDDVLLADGDQAALQRALSGRARFWYVRDYGLQDPAAAADADVQARAYLGAHRVLRQFDPLGVHVYLVEAAPAGPR